MAVTSAAPQVDVTSGEVIGIVGHVDPASTHPAPGGAAAFPDARPTPAALRRKPQGRKRVDRNQGKDLSWISDIAAGHIAPLDLRADLAGIPASKRLFLGRAFARCTDDLERVQSLGGAVLTAFSSPMHKPTPLSIDDARDKSGAIRDKAAVPVFGRWLILDGAPGMTRRPGKSFDRLGVLKLVAAVGHHCVKADRLEEEIPATVSMASGRLTDARIAELIHNVIGEEITVGAVKSLRKSAVHAVGDFLAHHCGGRPRKSASPLLGRVLDALDGTATKPIAATSSASSGRMVIRAARPGLGFNLAARYSSAGQAEVYRARAGASLDGPSVVYRSFGAATRRDDAAVYAPEVQPGAFRVDALFDRMEISISVRRWVPFRTLKAAVDAACGASVYVKDLTNRSSWLEALADAGATSLEEPGHYKILVQEPTPEKIAALLKAVDARCGLTGKAEIALLELSLDFIPEGTPIPAEREVFREQLVTVLHRHHHHWIDPALQPREAERRQSYSTGKTATGKKSRMRPIYRHDKRSGLLASVRDVARDEARAVILGTQPEEIFLNSTAYDGKRELGLEVSLQNKVTDQRNNAAGTVRTLPETERRARMEVILAANTLHETFGIWHLEDLTRERLRTIKRQHLSLFLPVMSDDPVMFAVEAERFARSGVYALDLYQRAVARQAGTRAATGKHGKLAAWTQIDARTGEAIDRLARRWRGYRAP